MNIVDVEPIVDCGRWPAKAVVGESIEICATVFREGHDAVAATAILSRPGGRVFQQVTMECTNRGLDHFCAHVTADRVGTWTFRIEAWSDPYATWEHAATVKVAAGVDTELMLAEGVDLLSRAAKRPKLPSSARKVLADAAAGLRDTSRPPQARLAAGLTASVKETLASFPLREMVSKSDEFLLQVEPTAALFSAWYEIFPRSEGATFDTESGTWTSGTLRTAAKRLPAIADMGFDVVYLTPIHPIGMVHRKGRNNSLEALPTDPGSPYAIGSRLGGHDAIHPQLGTLADFDHFVAQAKRHGVAVALDIALQCAPDHPWVTSHPQWFTTRLDGTIAYAENPPKKYQDIYPLNFDNDFEGIYAEIKRILEFWVSHGVTAFRVDNPHTKPVMFWERLLGEFRRDHPKVVFLAEAFTRPAMMHTLAKVGYHQSYTYFTWRNTATELLEYLEELNGPASYYMRPNFWPTTHDILTPYMSNGGRNAFAIRAILAATGSPSWGIYSGYEFVENIPRPGVEEQIDNEKYEFKPRDWAHADDLGIESLLRKLNAIRRNHPALQRLRGFVPIASSNPAIIAFGQHLSAAKSATGQADTVIVVVNLDPWNRQIATLDLDLAAFGYHGQEAISVLDLLSGQTFTWGAQVYVELDPGTQPAHVVTVQR